MTTGIVTRLTLCAKKAVFTCLFGFGLLYVVQPHNAWGQEEGVAIVKSAPQLSSEAIERQDQCIATMTGFPADNPVTRYQFFKLVQELAVDMTEDMRAALDFHGIGNVDASTPVMEVIDTIANPVLRQAAPETSIAHMDYLIDFAVDCQSYIEGQIESLKAYDPNLKDGEFNATIAQDALYLRQILSDVLLRLDADRHPMWGESVKAYAQALIQTRNRIEFQAFEADLESIEALYMEDLDGRLARSNDLINNEMDGETLGNAIALTDDLNEEARKKRKRKALQTLIDILNHRY